MWHVAEYMHSVGVGHRDLKLENILLDGVRPGRTLRRRPPSQRANACWGLSATQWSHTCIHAAPHMRRTHCCTRDVVLEELFSSHEGSVTVTRGWRCAGNPPRLKICDFGYSKNSRWDSAANSKVGTAAYVAPEVIINAQHSNYDAMVRRPHRRVPWHCWCSP